MLALLVSLTAHAHHPALVEGNIYPFPQTTLCKSADDVVEFQELFMERGLPVARLHLGLQIRAGKCGIFRGGLLKYLETVETWDHKGLVFRLLKLSRPSGAEYYTVFGWTNHELET